MLREMFEMRKRFMESLNDTFPGTYEKIPLDLFQKKHQQVCRDVALKGVEEMFEALGHLKNWKPHRSTEIKEIDRDEFGFSDRPRVLSVVNPCEPGTRDPHPRFVHSIPDGDALLRIGRVHLEQSAVCNLSLALKDA